MFYCSCDTSVTGDYEDVVWGGAYTADGDRVTLSQQDNVLLVQVKQHYTTIKTALITV